MDKEDAVLYIHHAVLVSLKKTINSVMDLEGVIPRK